MIFGRYTHQISAALGATINALILLQLIVLTPEAVAGINIAIGAWLVLLAGTSLTPTNDPHIAQGTAVTVVTPSGQPDKIVTLDRELVAKEGTPTS